MIVDNDGMYTIATQTKVGTTTMEKMAGRIKGMEVIRPKHIVRQPDWYREAGYRQYMIHRNGYDRLVSIWSHTSDKNVFESYPFNSETVGQLTFAEFLDHWLYRRSMGEHDINHRWLVTCEEACLATGATPVSIEEAMAIRPEVWPDKIPHTNRKGAHLTGTESFWTDDMVQAVHGLFVDEFPGVPSGASSRAGTYTSLRYGV